jgi:hypothetical protein
MTIDPRAVGSVIATGLLAAAAPGFAADSAPVVSHHLEGDWVRTDQNHSGSFDGLASSFAPAELTPQGKAALQSARRPTLRPLKGGPHKVGQAYVVVQTPCYTPGFSGGGALAVNPDSGAIHIVESRDQVVIAPERGGARIIYIDGRTLPDPTHIIPTGSGYGIGHYEQGALVVDTVGLRAGAVPAGGWRTPATHLHERFELSPDGQHLTVRYTYWDPAIYVKPHSYNYTFDRLTGDNAYALEDWCDSSDPKEATSIVPPSQQ